MVYFILDRGMSHDFTVLCDREIHDRHIQRITFRSIGFLESVIAGYNGNIRNFTVLIRVLAVNQRSVLIVNLDQGTRQLFRTGDIRLGNGYRNVDQLVQDRLGKLNHNSVLIGGFVCGCQNHGELLRAQLPSIRYSQFFQVIVAMRILSGNDQIAVLVCFRGSHQGVRRQLLVIGIVDN